jgi:O-antigen/teichoic acid export membrane protein
VHPRALVRDTLGTLLGQIVARAAVLVRGLVSAAVLGPAGLGGWNALSLLLDYGSWASGGALLGLDRELPAAVANHDRVRAARQMAGAWTITLLGGALFTLGTQVYLATGAHRIEGTWGRGAPDLMLVAVVLQLVIQYHASALRAQAEFQRVSAALATQAVLGGVLGMALVARFGVWALLWGWIAGSLAALVWLRTGRVRPTLVPGALRDGWALVRIGLPMFAYFMMSVVLRSLDRIALVRYAGNEGLGYYSLGLMTAGLILYLPEAAAAVLFPRLSAAALGAREAERTRVEVMRAQRAITVALPPLVAIGMVWAGPVVVRLLPAFAEGVASLRVLAIGALLLSASTLPGYGLLARGARLSLLTMSAFMLTLTALLVFSVAAHDRRPASIAVASAIGYGGFALGLLLLAAPGMCAGAGERPGFVVASLLPAMVAGASALAVCAFGGAETVPAALLRSLAVVVLYLPILLTLGRGVGLRRMTREWLTGRRVPV